LFDASIVEIVVVIGLLRPERRGQDDAHEQMIATIIQPDATSGRILFEGNGRNAAA
jgi:hypothetical protein